MSAGFALGLGVSGCIGGQMAAPAIDPDCRPSSEPAPVSLAQAPTQLTPGMVQTAFRRIPLPPSDLVVQPPDGRTLVNFDTNFYTEAEPLRRTVRLLGQQVDLDITPAAFTWRYGDGTSDTTTSPGAPYPDLQVTHAYASKGTVSASVDTTYSAVFRVNGGPWRPVPGVVTIEGEAQQLEVVTATPRLVGY